MGLDLDPQVGKARSRGMSRRGYGLFGLQAACLLMGGGVSLPSELVSLKHPSTGICRLSGGARPWC